MNRPYFLIRGFLVRRFSIRRFSIRHFLVRLARVIAVVALALFSYGTAQDTTLRFMGWVGLFDFQKPAWDYMIEEFERQHPGVAIEYIGTPFEETLNQATVTILGNNAPDVIQLVAGWTPQLDGMRALTPLDTYFDSEFLSDIPQSSLESVTFGGQLKALPWVPAPIVMAYNRNLLSEAGLDPDRPPATWPELVEAAERICALPAREDGGAVYGVSLRTARHPNSGHWSLPVIWGFGGDVLGEEGDIVVDGGGAVGAYGWYQDVVRSGCSPEGFGVQESRNVFGQGRAGFIFEGPWIEGLVDSLSEGQLKVAADGDVWVAPMPAGPGGQSRMIANSHVLVITEASQNKELAAEFIEFITSDEEAVRRFYEVTGQLPTAHMDLLTSGDMGENAYIQVFVDALPDSVSVPVKLPQWDAVTDALSVALQRAVQGQDPARALSQAADDIARILGR